MAAPAAPENLRIVTTTLSVSEAVSGLQFDIVTTGLLTLIVTGSMAFDYVEIDTNTYTVLVWVTENETFDGAFMYVVSGSTSSITNTIASDINGDEIEDVEITY